MRCYLFLSDVSCSRDVITNTFNGSRLTDLTCNKAPGFWMVEHQLVSGGNKYKACGAMRWVGWEGRVGWGEEGGYKVNCDLPFCSLSVT